jgi:hypothetical protein
MKDQIITDEIDLEDKLTEILQTVSGDLLQSVFYERMGRLKWVMEHEREYWKVAQKSWLWPYPSTSKQGFMHCSTANTVYLPNTTAWHPALASRRRSLKTLTSLYVEIFHCWMEYEQRVIIRFLLREDASANADDIRTRLQAQFTDDAYSI